MLSHCTTARASFLLPPLSSSFTFGSCKDSWYFRCIGMLLYNNNNNNKQKKTHKSKINRFLVSISFLGSAGPIRFVVKEDETVSNVIDYALKCYAREGRLPLLGSDSSFFLLYSPYYAVEAFNPWGKIGSTGSRNFVLSKKLEAQNLGGSVDTSTTTIRKTSGKWKAWLNKSLGLMVPSH
ncbi:hypothetical protein HID58_024077 [Brassica napus]|uniref:DUF7054 domain-containing protein n=4 Tax=Brassica TaxID=3705 RepID=A0ABQ8D3U9_BRANA|nr:hypothetical protein HID58_024077 [Brassica napus]